MKDVLPTQFRQHVAMYLLAVITGSLVGVAIVAFMLTIQQVQFTFFGTFSEAQLSSVMQKMAWWEIIVTPALGGLFVGLILYFFVPARRFHGINDVMESCALRGARTDARQGLLSGAAAAIGLGMGASLGREGPAVNIAAAISSGISKRLQMERDQSQVLMGCAAAAAVTASFNAPLAGVLFALEVVVGYYSLEVVTPVLISAAAAVVVSRNFAGDYPAFTIPEHLITSFWEVLAFVLLGALCALIAQSLIRVVIAVQAAWQKTIVPVWLRPMFAGAFVGFIALLFPHVLGVGYEATDLALKGGLPSMLMFGLLLMKLLTTGVCLGSSYAGGVFSPSLFLGAMLGGVFWFFASAMFPGMISSQGAYAVIGMAGVAAAVLGAPLSTLLIAFELTFDYSLTLAVMIVVAVACGLMQEQRHTSFFRWQLAGRGINLNSGRNESLLRATRIRATVSQGFSCVQPGITIAEAQRQLATDRTRLIVVVDAENNLIGSLSLKELIVTSVNEGGGSLLEHAVHNREMSVPLNSSVKGALEAMRKYEVDYMPVVENEEGGFELAGILNRADVLAVVNDTFQEARSKEYGIN